MEKILMYVGAVNIFQLLEGEDNLLRYINTLWEEDKKQLDHLYQWLLVDGDFSSFDLVKGVFNPKKIQTLRNKPFVWTLELLYLLILPFYIFLIPYIILFNKCKNYFAFDERVEFLKQIKSIWK